MRSEKRTSVRIQVKVRGVFVLRYRVAGLAAPVPSDALPLVAGQPFAIGHCATDDTDRLLHILAAERRNDFLRKTHQRLADELSPSCPRSFGFAAPSSGVGSCQRLDNC
jgi:hypothetical protein